MPALLTTDRLTYRASRPASGGHASPRLAVSFPEEIFRKIKKRAARKKVSFASMVRELVAHAIGG